MNKPNDQGQRVKVPSAVDGDTPVDAEKDAQGLKDDMRQAAKGNDVKLKNEERRAEEDVQAVRPEHRQNDAGQ